MTTSKTDEPTCTCGGKPDTIQAKNWGHTHSKSCPLYKEIEGFDYPPPVDDLDAYTARAVRTGDWSW